MTDKLIWIYEHGGTKNALNGLEPQLLDAAVWLYQTAIDNNATQKQCLAMFRGAYKASHTCKMGDHGKVMWTEVEDSGPNLVMTCKVKKMHDGFTITTNGIEDVLASVPVSAE